jgi:ubiquitin carboxyl-terminal hydrolase 7
VGSTYLPMRASSLSRRLLLSCAKTARTCWYTSARRELKTSSCPSQKKILPSTSVSNIASLAAYCANPTVEKRLDDEAAEREARRKDREEAHLYLNVRVVTDDTFRAYGGTDLAAWDAKHEVDASTPRSYRLLRRTTVQELIETIAEDTDSDPKRLRLWCMVNRQNKTVRPDAPIGDPDMTIEQALHKLSGNKTQDLRLWAELFEETSPGDEVKMPANSPSSNGAVSKADIIILFLKLFDIESQTITGAGHIYISRDKKVEDLVPEILKKMGWPERTESGEKQQLKLFEVGDPSGPISHADHHLGDQACYD